MHITYNGGCNCFTFVVVVVYCVLPVERCRWRRLRWCFGVFFFAPRKFIENPKKRNANGKRGKLTDETENEHNNRIGAEVANANIRQSSARTNGFLRSSAVSHTVHSHTIVGIAGSEHTSHDICWPLGARLVRLLWIPKSIAFRVGWVDFVLNSWRLIAQIWEKNCSIAAIELKATWCMRCVRVRKIWQKPDKLYLSLSRSHYLPW